MVVHKKIEILTKEYNALVKITEDVKHAVKESGICDGVAFVITAILQLVLQLMKDLSVWKAIFRV